MYHMEISSSIMSIMNDTLVHINNQEDSPSDIES